MKMKEFQVMNADSSILVRKVYETVTIVNVYVDDLLIAS